MFNKRLLAEFKNNLPLVFGMVACQWCMMMANALLMFGAGQFINNVVTTAQGGAANLQAQKYVLLKEGLILFGALIVTALVRGLLSYGNNRLSFRASSEVKEKLRTKIFGKLMKLGTGYHKGFNSSEITQLATEGVDQLEIYFGKYVPQFFYALIAPVTLFFIIGPFMSWKVAAVLLICVPLIPVSIVAVQKFAKKLLAKYWGTYTQMGDSFLECLQGLTTLKIYNADGHYADKLDKEAQTFRHITMRVLIMQLNSVSVMDLVAYGGTALGVILSILEFKADNITLAQTFFIIMISAEFFLPMRLLGSYFHIAMNGNAAADKIFRLLDTQVNEEPAEEKLTGSKSIEIKMNKVSFSYEEDKPVLKNISLECGTGFTAFVGESGSGKSTIANILMKDLTPQSGSVQVNGIPLEDISHGELYRNITRITHDSYLFAGTVKENLLMGKADATEDEMWKVLKEVQLEDFVKNSGGLNYKLIEKAANLSGGQKQRLALARALLHDSKVYIFDEATSSIDIESENAIMKVVKKLAKSKTVIMISHRLANVVNADSIYVLKDGKITQSGKHTALVAKTGFYKTLFNRQKELEAYGKEAL